jgi:hypothetical protein
MSERFEIRYGGVKHEVVDCGFRPRARGDGCYYHDLHEQWVVDSKICPALILRKIKLCRGINTFSPSNRRCFEFAFHDLQQYNNVTQSQRERLCSTLECRVTLNWSTRWSKVNEIRFELITRRATVTNLVLSTKQHRRPSGYGVFDSLTI